jgi:hypothetical protein
MLRCACEERTQSQHGNISVSLRQGGATIGPAASCQWGALLATAVADVPLRQLRRDRAAIRPQGISRAFETCWARMTIRVVMRHTVSVGLLLLSGCEATRNMGNDFARLTSPQAPSAQPKKKVATAVRPRPATMPASPEVPPLATETAAAAPAPRSSDVPAVTFAGKSDSEVRAMLGTPTSEEERPPGKRWRYRDGQCTLDVQLFPDVQTKQFGTLAYEVKSDDNTDEGKRLCLAQFQSRVQARN